MKKLDLDNMKILTNDFQNKIELNWKDETGEKLFLEVKGLGLDDFTYLVDNVPKTTLLNFVEGFSSDDVNDINDYVINKTEKSFNDVYYSIIAAGSGQYNKEEDLKKILTTPQALMAFKSIIKQTIPQNKDELAEIKEAFRQMEENKGKKLKSVLRYLMRIVKVLASK